MTRRKTSDAAACIGRQALPVMIGIVLALVVGLLATVIGFDRDRSLYPVILIVIASYYCLFAVMGGSAHALIVETAIFAAFGALAVLGFKTNMGWIIAALAAHGVMDLFHQGIVTNAGVPSYWPQFCSAYDITAAIYLGLRFWQRRVFPLGRSTESVRQKHRSVHLRLRRITAFTSPQIAQTSSHRSYPRNPASSRVR